MSKDTGGPAFPCGDTRFNNAGDRVDGMTLRDYFAAKALVGLISEPDCGEDNEFMAVELARGDTFGAERFASAAYAMADAMLAERAK